MGGTLTYLSLIHAIVHCVKKLTLYLTTFANECGEIVNNLLCSKEKDQTWV